MAGSPPPAPAAPARSRSQGWVRLAALILVALGVAFAGWWLIRSDSLRDSEHSRNIHELDIAARLIESWPRSVRAMAVGNLLPTRIDATHPADLERGWQKAARFLHPRLGTIYVHYGVTKGGICPEADTAVGPTGNIGFEAGRGRMHIAGAVETSEFWYADQLALADAGTVAAITPADAAQFAQALGLAFKEPPAHICFKADLPLAEIVDLPTTAPEIKKLILVDRSGNLLAQLGGAPLPMASVDELSRLRPMFDSLLDAAAAAASQGKAAVQPPKDPGPVVDLAAPTEVTIGGESYFAYTRSLNLPADFPANVCKAGGGESKAAAPGSGVPPERIRTCLIMGLVPTADVNAASLRVSPAALTGFALVLGLLIALLPLLKLRLIGPGDALRRIEVAAVAFGIVTAVAIGTLTLLFAQGYVRDNQRAFARAQQIAEAMTADFRREFAAATASPAAFKALPASNGSFRIIEPAAPGALACRRPNGDSVPLALVTTSPDAGTIFQRAGRDGWWPVIESSALFGEFGMAWPGFAPVLNRCDRGTRANVSQRGYFRAAMNGSPGDGSFGTKRFAIPGLEFSGEYRVGAVRAQPDGIEKVIIAAPFQRDTKDQTRGPQRGALLETFVARTFVAPVLPEPYRFIVVDSGDPALPVLFASNPSRIEVDRFADDVGGDAGATIANARCARDTATCGTAATQFSTQYEGIRQHFVAHGLPGTPWVLLVHYPADAIARPLADAAVFAASAWIGLALVVLIGITVFTAWRGAAFWHWSWPRPGGGRAYSAAARRVFQLAAAATLVCLLLLALPGPLSGLLRLVIALATPAAAIAIVVTMLRRHAGDRARFLDPADEAAFRNLAVALLLTIGALPMAMFWADSRESSFAAEDAAQVGSIRAATAASIQTRLTLMRAFRTDSPDAVTLRANSADTPAAQPDAFGLYARYAFDLRRHDAITDGTWSSAGPLTRNLRQWSDSDVAAVSLNCAAAPADTMQARATRILCNAPDLPAPDAVNDTRAGLDIAWFRWFCFLLLAGGVIVLLRGALDIVLRCLFGHGVPLEAVNHPGIRRHPDGRLDLPAKALILNAPLALRLELLESFEIVDLSDPAPATLDTSKPKLLITGLALALRDPTLRANALLTLERLSRSVDVAERAYDLANKPGSAPNQLVVMTDLSPLDRILQAYESEQALAGHTLGEEGRREQLRWSRLFETFTTIGFTPVSKLSPASPADFTDPTLTRDEREGIAKLVNEVRDLPEVVIDSLLNTPDEAVARYWRNRTRNGSFPIDPSKKLYETYYDKRVRDWAERIRPASREAAIDYLRGTLIEHYQYIWIASSHAERVILDSLAHGRTVNIASALALRSLVRRGLIRFDPVPRLINDSFAAFVIQAEKPMQIKAWRAEQPDSLWQRSSLPLMILLPVAIIGLVAVALYSGERALGLMPLLLGSAPALIGTLGALRRNA